jgi:acetyltransferase-like isoleucine patch superfamily enzyme
VNIIASKYQVKSTEIIRSFPQFEKEIIIGDDVWLGANSIILPGVKIGRGVIVGAGAVVTKDVAEFDIVAGVPAIKINSRIHV